MTSAYWGRNCIYASRWTRTPAHQDQRQQQHKDSGIYVQLPICTSFNFEILVSEN